MLTDDEQLLYDLAEGIEVEELQATVDNLLARRDDGEEDNGLEETAEELLDEAAMSLPIKAINDASKQKFQQFAIQTDDCMDEMSVQQVKGSQSLIGYSPPGERSFLSPNRKKLDSRDAGAKL